MKNNKTNNKTNNKVENKKSVTQSEFLKIVAESKDKDSVELLNFYEITDFSESETKKVENKKSANCKFKTCFSFLEKNKSEFLKLTEKYNDKLLLFHQIMENEQTLTEFVTSEKFCSKDMIKHNKSILKDLDDVADFTMRKSVKEKTLNKFQFKYDFMFSISKNHIESLLDKEDKEKFSVLALRDSLYFVNEKGKKAKLLYSLKSHKMRAMKNAHYMQVSNIVEVLKQNIKTWKLELN